MPDRTKHVRVLLSELREGDESALDRLLPLVYDDLRRIARRHLRGERPDHTLRTTALVHEAYIEIAGGDGEWRDRAHFMAACSTVMRHLLVDHARRKSALKRGGDRVRVTLDDELSGEDPRVEDVVELHDALSRLGEHDPRLEKVVECRFFGGMTVADTAEALDLSRRTVERDWTRARAYLHRALAPDENHPDG